MFKRIIRILVLLAILGAAVYLMVLCLKSGVPLNDDDNIFNYLFP